MKTKESTQESRKHLSQNVYSLVINYKTCSRCHRHTIVFSITEDLNLLKVVNKFLKYSESHLIHIYPWLNPIQRTSFEVCLIPVNEYRIAPAIASYTGFLREQIVVTPYDAHMTDFSFASFDESISSDMPF